MGDPFFTVIIPTHNRSKLLKRAVGSVLKQTFRDFELIIIDDYSTDNTRSIVENFSDTRIIYKENDRKKGACGARNVGINAAKGKWVAFLDDDDIWMPEKLRYQYKLGINSDKSVGLICTDYAIYKGKNRKAVIHKNRPTGLVKDKVFGSIGCLSSTCVRTSILRNIDGFDESFPSNQDQDLWLRIADTYKFIHVPKILVWFFHDYRKDRISLNYNSKLDGWIMLRDKYSDLLNKNIHLKSLFESRIFTYSLLQMNFLVSLQSTPWVLVNAFVDFPNFIHSAGNTIMLLYKRYFFNIDEKKL